MADDSNIGKVAAHYIIARGAMTSIKAYADRGRKFASFSDDHLRAEFVSVFKAWAIDPFDFAIRERHSDVSAEYALRNQEPPYDVVALDLDKICNAASEMFKTLPQERWEEIGESIMVDYLQAQQCKS